jgi:hypothetical protein
MRMSATLLPARLSQVFDAEVGDFGVAAIVEDPPDEFDLPGEYGPAAADDGDFDRRALPGVLVAGLGDGSAAAGADAPDDAAHDLALGFEGAGCGDMEFDGTDHDRHG